MEARIALGIIGLLYGASFIVFRVWWTKFFTAINFGGAPEWFPRVFPYIGAALAVVWSLIMFTGWFGNL